MTAKSFDRRYTRSVNGRVVSVSLFLLLVFQFFLVISFSLIFSLDEKKIAISDVVVFPLCAMWQQKIDSRWRQSHLAATTVPLENITSVALRWRQRAHAFRSLLKLFFYFFYFACNVFWWQRRMERVLLSLFFQSWVVCIYLFLYFGGGLVMAAIDHWPFIYFLLSVFFSFLFRGKKKSWRWHLYFSFKKKFPLDPHAADTRRVYVLINK